MKLIVVGEIKMNSVFEGKKVMVTGGLGFIGSNLTRKLVAQGADVLIVDSLIPDCGGNLFNIYDIKQKIKVNLCDLRDENSLSHLVPDQDYIFNLAGLTSHIDSMTNPFADMETNCRGQLSFLEVCRKKNPKVKIVYAGTRQIYGSPKYLPVDENHPISPPDINGINKFAGEWYHIVYNNVYDLKATSLRLTNTYGPRMLMRHSRLGFVSWFIRKAIDGEEITIYGDGKQFRDFNYVDDVVDAFLMAAASDKTNGQIFNLGGQESVSLSDFVKLLIAVCGTGRYRFVPFPEETKKIDIGNYLGDYRKIKKILGWEPKTSLREGLEQTVHYYRKNKVHYW